MNINIDIHININIYIYNVVSFFDARVPITILGPQESDRKKRMPKKYGGRFLILKLWSHSLPIPFQKCECWPLLVRHGNLRNQIRWKQRFNLVKETAASKHLVQATAGSKHFLHPTAWVSYGMGWAEVLRPNDLGKKRPSSPGVPGPVSLLHQLSPNLVRDTP